MFTIAFCSVSCHISTSFEAPFTSIPNTLPLFFCVSVISLLSPCIEPEFVKSEILDFNSLVEAGMVEITSIEDSDYNTIKQATKILLDKNFVAIKGVDVDGHTFINTAIDKGATCIICEILPLEIDQNICFIKVITKLRSKPICSAAIINPITIITA